MLNTTNSIAHYIQVLIICLMAASLYNESAYVFFAYIIVLQASNIFVLIDNKNRLFFELLGMQSTIIIMAFIVFPRIFVFTENLTPLIAESNPQYVIDANAYIGSLAEKFIGLCAGLLTLASTIIRQRNNLILKSIRISTTIQLVVVLMSMVTCFLYAFARSHLSADITFPIMSFAIALLVLSGSRWSVFVWAICCLSCLLNHEIKLSISLCAILVLGWLYEAGLSRKVVFALGMTGLLVLTVPVLFSASFTSARDNAWEGAQLAIRTKLLLRQTETAHCMDVAFARHWAEPLDISKIPHLFVGLVPRLIWPDKPQISDGRRYTIDYCQRWEASSKPPSSSTLTVMGEPVVVAGKSGAVVALGFILLLGVLNDGLLSRWHSGGVLSLALWPLAVDLDQNFMMYVARLGKGGAVVLLLMVLIIICRRRGLVK